VCLQEKELRITEQEEALHGASQRIQELDADLARKRDFLAGISTVGGKPAEAINTGRRTAFTN
jgi:hypothetical protein